jgi:hypothetical protein
LSVAFCCSDARPERAPLCARAGARLQEAIMPIESALNARLYSMAKHVEHWPIERLGPVPPRLGKLSPGSSRAPHLAEKRLCSY